MLFGNKVDKVLGKCHKKEVPLQVRYSDGAKLHECKVYRYARQKLVITGFAASLREDLLVVNIPEMNISFETKVTATSHDLRNRLLYHCTVPEPGDLKPISKEPPRFFIYPKGVGVLVREKDEGQILKLKFYIWDISDALVDLVDTSEEDFLPGDRFVASKLIVGKEERLVDLEVTGTKSKAYGRKEVNLLSCKFLSKIEDADPFLELCKKIDGL
jgi:hypothetical protein